jgi:hypothetical protein
MSVAALIQELLTELNYADHLQKSQPDWESRWENVRELITFATETTLPVPDLSTNGSKENLPTVELQPKAADGELFVQRVPPATEAEVDSYFDDADSSTEDESPMIEELEA